MQITDIFHVCNIYIHITQKKFASEKYCTFHIDSTYISLLFNKIKIVMNKFKYGCIGLKWAYFFSIFKYVLKQANLK